MLKALSLVMSLGSFLSSLNPGCGVSAAPANGGSTSSTPSLDNIVGASDCGVLGSHTFCDDFSGNAVPSHFDRQEAENGNVAIDGGALGTSTVKPPFATRTMARLVKDVSAKGSRFALAFTETVDPGCLGSGDRVDTTALVTNDGKHILVIGHRNDGDAIIETSLENGIFVHSHELQTKLPHGRAVRIELHVDYNTKTISVVADGKTISANEPLTQPPSEGITFAPTVIAGQLSDNLAHPSACAVTTDDVTLDVAP